MDIGQKCYVRQHQLPYDLRESLKLHRRTRALKMKVSKQFVDGQRMQAASHVMWAVHYTLMKFLDGDSQGQIRATGQIGRGMCLITLDWKPRKRRQKDRRLFQSAISKEIMEAWRRRGHFEAWRLRILMLSSYGQKKIPQESTRVPC